MPTPAGGSNLTISSRFRTPPTAAPSALNLGPPPGSGGAIVKVTPQSQALIPRAKPALPAYNPPPFAEPPPPPQQIYFTKQPTLNPRPVGNLADIPKPIPNLPKTPLTIPKGAPVVGVVAKSGIVQVASRAGVVPALVSVAAEVLIHDAKQLYKLYKLSQPEAKIQTPPLRGGQDPNKLYVISGTVTERAEPLKDIRGYWGPLSTSGNAELTWTFDKEAYVAGSIKAGIPGPITITSKAGDKLGQSTHSNTKLKYGTAQVDATIQNQKVYAKTDNPYMSEADKKNSFGYPNNSNRTITSIDLAAIPMGQNEPEPEPLLKRAPLKSAANSPDALPQFLEPPAPRRKLDLVPNLAPPPADKPLESNKKIPITITTPGAGPITISAPGAAPVTISPSGSPATIKITRSAAASPTAPAGSPTTPTGDPTSKPAPVPIAVSSPNAPPTNLIMPGGGPITITTPGQEPITFDPATGKPIGVQSDPNQKPSAYISTPTAPTTDPTTTPTSPLTTPAPKDLPEIGLALVGITQLLQGIAPKVTPTAIASAVCETTKPSGCTTGAIDKGVSKGNEDLKQFLTNQLPNIIGSGANAAIGLDTNARVKKVEADTAKIRESTGSDRYPMVWPEYLLDDFIDKPVQIPDQVAYNVWLLKQIDALVGLFPIKIERTDENGVKQMLKFENIAEAIAELTGLLAEIAFDADTSVNVGVHAISEAIGAKIAAIQATSYLKAICEYLGFQGQPTAINVPISCTPGAVGIDDKLQENELEDFLKSSTQKAVGWECKERDDLHSIIKRILFDSEVSRAALYKPLKPEQLTQQTGFTGDAIKKDKIKEKQKDNDEWEAFKTRIKNQEGTGVDVDLEEKSLTDESTSQ